MPYDNFPKEIPTEKIESCVNKVMASGKPKPAAIAICYNSLVKGKEINYRKFVVAMPTEKAITDAPNLRSEDERNCWNCKYFTPLPDSTMQENVNDVAGKLSAPSDMVEMASGRGTCSQFEFETDREWICDAWETYVPEPAIATMKQVDGKYRWILFSSSSYQDKDGEIVSQKALESDTERMNTTKEYGTLDWWHTPIVLGDCDFSEMHGRISIESGTFRDDWIGARFATMKNLGASRMFYNPANEPDAEGVYNNIRTFRRAILPADRASNRLTLVDISAKEQQMTMKDKVSELISKLGGTPDAEKKVADLVQAAEQADTAAASAGLTSKETAPETPPTAPETKAWFVSDMTPDEFDARLTAVVEKFLTPAVKEIGAHVASMNDANTITAKETSDKLVAQLKSTQDMQTDLSARLAALEGLTPRAYRATSDPKTAVSATTVKEATPKGDGKANDSLASWLTAA